MARARNPKTSELVRPLLSDWAWQAEGVCRRPNVDASLFFAPEGDTKEGSRARKARVAKAKVHCMQCPVRALCLELALATKEQYGIRGGLTEAERKRLLKKPPKPETVEPTQDPPAAASAA
jgi:WhiB family redox-sensing transcriptional regulator